MRQVILLLAAISALIVLSSCGVNSANDAGVINGRRIPYDQFIASYRAHYENFYTEKGRPPDLEEKKALERLTWTNITKYIILQEHYKKYKISVTNQEVLDTLMINPPSYILNSPWFLVNGVFNRSSYIQSLQTDSPYNLRPVRKQYFDNEIPIAKLKVKLIDEEYFTRRQKEMARRILSSKADIDWIIFDADKADTRIADAQIEEYYQTHLQDFMKEPYFSVVYSYVPAVLTEDDLDYSLAVRDSIWGMLADGMSFESIANEPISTREAITINDTGYLTIMELDPKIKSEVINLETGQYSQPVQSSSSIDFYRLEHKTRSMIKLSKLQIPIKAQEASITTARRMAANFVELARTLGFEQAAHEMDLPVYRSQRFSPGEAWLDDAVLQNQLDPKLLQTGMGNFLPSAYSTAKSAWIVAQLTEKQLQEPVLLADARAEINTILVEESKIDLTKQAAAQWLQQAAPEYTPDRNTDSYKVQQSMNLRYTDQLWDKDISNIYYQTIKAHLSGQTPAMHQLDNLIVVPIVRKLEIEADRVPDPAQMRAAFVKNMPADWFERWMDEKLNSARIRTIPIN